MSARTSAAGREPSPLPQQNNTTPGTNEAPQMKQSKKLSMSGKLFRLDSPAKSVKPTTPTTPRINGEGTDNSYRIPSMVFDESADGAQNTNPNGDSNRTSPARKSIPPISGAVRRVSDSIDVLANGDMPRAGALSPPSENQWSSAVGHATTNGKSGRVIERLMAENDRLKRELELQLLRSQELERNLETMRPQIEALRTENDNLNHANTMDEAMLARRDRKIEQLKEEAASERSRREASDLLARRLEREHEEVQETASRDVQLAQEQAKHSTTHATILEQSHRQLAQEYRQRAERWRKDITELQAQRQADGEKFARIDVVGEQMRSELERARKIQAEFVEKWDEYQSANEEWKNGVEHVADFENSRMRKLSEEMETITNKMKWVMSLEKSRGGGGA